METVFVQLGFKDSITITYEYDSTEQSIQNLKA